MQSCLGIYIENNIVKYAKLHKEKDNVKVESYNVVFYDNNLGEVLKRIISETYSHNIPISINVSDEIYNTFEISTLLSKTDTRKAIDIEFNMLCDEKGYNKVAIEHRYLLVNQREDAEKQKVLSIASNKNEISKITKLLPNVRISSITPITTSIANLVDPTKRENVIIVNIEKNTKITTIIDNQIYQIDVIDEGMEKILREIDETENSLSKSYEVIKNMTIYTQGSPQLFADTNEYIDIVAVTLDKIADEIKKIINSFLTKIDKVYITGAGANINNIDLYFQEYITESRCEILKPYFLDNVSVQIPVKEYIEVNSAIALALDGVGMLNKDVNFAKGSKAGSGAKGFLSKEITLSSIKDGFCNLGHSIKHDFSMSLHSSEKLLVRGIKACLIIAVLFVIFSKIISSQIERKYEEIAAATTDANVEIAKLDSDISIISTRTETYKKLIQEITNPTATTSSNTRVISQDAIPNLLNRIMFSIPKKVKLTSIKNTTDKHIVITAEAEKYEQLGYFKASLTTNGILENVKSTTGEKTNTVVEVTIEGDLP